MQLSDEALLELKVRRLELTIEGTPLQAADPAALRRVVALGD